MKKPGKMVREVLRSVFKKPATVRYPFVKVTMPDKFRGKLKFIAENCMGCKLCMRDCPSGAIIIRKIGDKQFEAEADIDMGKCIYCAQCVDVCPTKALVSTGQFELASLQRGALKETHRRTTPRPASKPESEPPPEPPPDDDPEGKHEGKA